MAITPWRPFWDLERFFEEEWPGWSLLPEKRFGHHFAPKVRTPLMDMYETDKEVIAKFELPGTKLKNIDVTVKDNILNVEAKTKKEKEKKDKGYYRKELFKSHYQRTVPLPVEVIGNKAKADYKDGVLRVSIPKKKKIKKEKRKTKIRVKKREEK